MYTALYSGMANAHWPLAPVANGHWPFRCIKRYTSYTRGVKEFQSYTAIQRYTVYSYTALYSIQPLHHPSDTTARRTWVQAAGGTVRTARSTRGNTETRAGPNGAIGGFYRRLDPRVGPLHREIACPGGTQGGLNCLTHAPPRCFPTPNRRRMGTGTSSWPGGGVPWAAARGG